MDNLLRVRDELVDSSTNLDLENNNIISDSKMVPARLDEKSTTVDRKQSECKDNIENRNYIYPAASDKLKILRSAQVGRYAVAAKDIQVGEAVIVEDASVSIQKPETFGDFCHHCLSRSLKLLPCPTCAEVGFCTTACQEDAMNSYHKFECKLLPLISTHPLADDWLLTLRTATNRNVRELLEEYEEYEKCAKFGLFDLESHSSSMPLKTKSVVAFGAALLTSCLSSVGYFVEENTSEVRRRIAAILYRTLQVAKFNTHSIMAQDDAQPIPGRKKIGLAIYPVLSLLNHSCNPNVFKYYIGDRVYVIALREIRAGEEIANCYGPRYANDSYEKRQDILSRKFYFNCACQACSDRWPIADKSDDTFVCQICNTPLQNSCACGQLTAQHVQQLCKETLMLWFSGRKAAVFGNVGLALQKIQEALTKLGELEHPSKLKSSIEWDFVLFKSMQGNGKL